jgi:predicted AlkP superfamily phosphohydrolase/phosphomutase
MGFAVSVFDIAPTILSLYGIPQPAQMKGHVLTEIFDVPGSQAAVRNAR